MSLAEARLQGHWGSSTIGVTQLWWVLAYPVLCLPFIRVHGSVYAALLLVSLLLLLNTKFKAAALCIVGLHLYQVLVTFLWTTSVADVRELNSPLMIQTSAALLVIGLFNFCGLSQALVLSLAIAVIAGLGILSESFGIDVQAMLPSKYHDADSFMPGAIVYVASDLRLRGVYAEASALGAVCGGLASMSLLGLLTRRLPHVARWISAFTLITTAIVLLVTLTKAGFVMLLVGVFVGVGLMVLNRQTALLARTVTCLGTLAFVSAIAASFASERMRDYLLSEWESLLTLIAGGQASAVAGKGAFGRWEGYEIGIAALLQYPLGSFPGNVVSIATEADIPLSEELTYYFSHGVYGLKNYLANLSVTAGVVGIIVFLLFLKLLCRGFVATWSEQEAGCSVLVGVACVSSVVFAGIVEDRYFVPAYAALLLGLAFFYRGCPAATSGSGCS